MQSKVIGSSSAIKLVPRWSQDRNNADHGWLKTFLTFTFALDQQDEHSRFGSLRVLNEDRIAAHAGFGTHSHKEFEIFSYVVSGQLEHEDSMGNTEILKRGDIQLTSAGTGISHSEKAHGNEPVHFLQIWSEPTTSGLTPRYFTRHFSDDEKIDKWARVVAPINAEGVTDDREGSGPAPVQSRVTLYATVLGPGKALDRKLQGTEAYIHVAQTAGYNPSKASGARVKVRGSIDGDGELQLREGDGAYAFIGQQVNGLPMVVENNGDRVAEVLVFDLS